MELGKRAFGVKCSAAFNVCSRGDLNEDFMAPPDHHKLDDE